MSTITIYPNLHAEITNGINTIHSWSIFDFGFPVQTYDVKAEGFYWFDPLADPVSSFVSVRIDQESFEARSGSGPWELKYSKPGECGNTIKITEHLMAYSGSDPSISLDKLSVTGNPCAIPEPGIMPLFLLGLFLLVTRPYMKRWFLK